MAKSNTPGSATGAPPKSGLVAVVGRPNVGKSTLVNALVGQKVSIVAAKPHTTRHRILGVLNDERGQAVFIDTPGHAERSKRALHRIMARTFRQSLDDCDLVLLVIDARGPTSEDERLMEVLEGRLERTIVVLNKLDRLAQRADVLPVLERLSERPFAAFVPISAKKGTSLGELVGEIMSRLPEGPKLFPDEMATDRDLSFRAAELIREKLIENLHREVPYGLTVEVEHLARDEQGAWLVHGLIWIEKETHKPIVIGRQGRVLKRVGSDARGELERLLGGHVRLELWVKVREHWTDSERELARLGFDTT